MPPTYEEPEADEMPPPTPMAPAGANNRFARSDSRRAFSRGPSMAHTPYADSPRAGSPALSMDGSTMAPRGANQVLRITRTVKGVKTVEVIKDPAVMESYMRRYQEREVVNMHGKLDELKPTGDSAKDALQKQAYVITPHHTWPDVRESVWNAVKGQVADRVAFWKRSRTSKRIRPAALHVKSTPCRTNAVLTLPTKKRLGNASAVHVAAWGIPKPTGIVHCSSTISLQVDKSARARLPLLARRPAGLVGSTTLRADSRRAVRRARRQVVRQRRAEGRG